MTNKTIGMVTCPLCNEPAAVRKNKNNKFYYISRAGLITPSHDFGQAWFVENAQIWGEDGSAPPGAPDWIAEDRSNPDNTLSQVRTRRAAETEPTSREDDVDVDAGGGDPPPDPPPADADDDTLFGDFLTGGS